jgi:serine/threonine protein kinase
VQRNIDILINSFGGCQPFKQWKPINIIGQGFGRGLNEDNYIYQVCQSNQCNAVLKIVEAGEAEITMLMGDRGIAPRVIDIFTCGTQTMMVMEKIDGDLSDFLYPPRELDVIMAQVLDLLYRVLIDHGISHNDTKVDNFLWKWTDGAIRVYLADYGLAEQCIEPCQEKLRQSLNLFNKSYMSPEMWGVKNSYYQDLDDGLMKYFLRYADPQRYPFKDVIPDGGQLRSISNTMYRIVHAIELSKFIITENTLLRMDPHWSGYYTNSHGGVLIQEL